MERLLAAAVGAAPAALLALACLAAALMLRITGYRGLSFGLRQNILAGGCALTVLLAVAWWFGLREVPPTLPPLPPNGVVFDEIRHKAVSVGDAFPILPAKGWLNGSPRLLDASGRGVTVVDVWNELCPMCHLAAPGLIAVHENYAGQGVRFVGMTGRRKEDAQNFIARHGIDWPNAYGVGALGLAAPQVFILDSEGQVV